LAITTPAPDPGGAQLADVARDDAPPPWLAFAQAEGIVFRPPAADVAQASDGNPPWLQAAADTGVVFYDPEGFEVVVPSGQVVAFKAGLESVRDFERSWVRRCNTDEAAGAPNCESQVACAAEDLEDGTREEVPVEKDDALQPLGVDGGSQGVRSADAREIDEASQRQDLKSVVQRRYFALLRDGLEPNEAAVRAILEAKRAWEDGCGGQNSTSSAASAGQTQLNSSRGGRQNCASSVKDSTQEERRTVNEEVTVVN